MKINYKTISVVPQLPDVDSGIIENVEVIKFDGYETQFTIFDKTDVIVKNQFDSTIQCKLTPIQVAVHDMFMGSTIAINRGLGNNDMFRANQESQEIFCANWPREYNLLLD